MWVVDLCTTISCCYYFHFVLSWFFLIGIHFMQGSRATTRHGFTRKRSSKRFKTYRTLNDSNDTNFESKFFSPFSTKKSFVDKDQDPDVNFYHNVSVWRKMYCVYITPDKFKDTHREKATSNKTPCLEKVRIWAFGLLVH